MRAVPMCFSILQVPKCRIHTLANFCWESFHNLNRSYGNNSNFRLLSSKTYALEGGYSKRWTRRPITTKTEGSNKTTRSSKPREIRDAVLDVKVSTNRTINLIKPDISDLQRIQYYDIRQEIAENKDLANLVTIIVFDIETTGFSREKERIIEIGFQDLQGGENSIFQTLVNPGCYVPNSHVHGITTHMVCRADVPRMEDLIPILLQYVKSREKPGGFVLFVAHNGRTFDVPFLEKEFSRCQYEFPQNWLFVDTIPMARELMKSLGSKLSPRISLQALREHYGIPLMGSAHRAMSDVYSLSLILKRLTFDLKLTKSDLVQRSFRPSDFVNIKKKKNSS